MRIPFRLAYGGLTQCHVTVYTVFQKKTPTHIISYKLKNSCLISIIFDTKIPHIIQHRVTAYCLPHLTNVSTLPCKTHCTRFVAIHYKHALFCDKSYVPRFIKCENVH